MGGDHFLAGISFYKSKIIKLGCRFDKVEFLLLGMEKIKKFSKSVKKFIRTQKAQIRRQFWDIKKQEELIKEMYEKVKPKIKIQN